MLLLLDVYGLKCATNNISYYLLSRVPTLGIYVTNVTMSISIGLYPKLDQWTVNKLHYITLHYITLHYITLHYITLHYITVHMHSFQHG
jgi:hypothetical protein